MPWNPCGDPDVVEFQGQAQFGRMTVAHLDRLEVMDKDARVAIVQESNAPSPVTRLPGSRHFSPCWLFVADGQVHTGRGASILVLIIESNTV